jgi:hypothetical protein
MITRADGAHPGTKLGPYQIQSPEGALDTLLVDWTPDDRRLSLNEKLTLRTEHLIFRFFDFSTTASRRKRPRSVRMHDDKSSLFKSERSYEEDIPFCSVVARICRVAAGADDPRFG